MTPAGLTFRPMSTGEFEQYVKRAVPEYANEHIRAGDVHPEVALAKASEEYAQLLPQGVATPGHYLYAITSADGDTSVGMLWFELRERQNTKSAFLFDVHLEPEYRGKGLGRRVMEELEVRVKELGARSIGLFVFGDNSAARTLYEKCGFRYANMYMTKDLG